jgi:hypothetical protein
MTVVADRLASWLQGRTLIASAEDLAPYQRAIEQLSAAFAASDALQLVATAHDVADAHDDAHAAVARVAAEQSLPVEAGGQLAAVLAGAALVDILDRESSQQAIVAALGTASCTFLSAPPIVPELPGIADVALERLADSERQSTLVFAKLRGLFDANLGALPLDNSNPVSSSELREAMRTLRRGIRTALDEADGALGALRANTHRVSEEIDLLWWTLRPFSPLLSPWSGSATTVCVVAGVEVGQRIVADPPPRGLDLLIDEALTKAGVDPSTTVDAAELTSGAPDGLTLPDRPAGTAWATPALNAVMGEAPTPPLASAASWARQIVLEMSLLRAAYR